MEESILAATFQAIGNICFAAKEDRYGCERKQHAVSLGCLEAVCTGMQNAPESQWVQEAGCIAIGSLCNGTDPDGHYRRTHALTMGAIEFALRVSRVYDPRVAIASHKEAYTAAVHTIRAVAESDAKGRSHDGYHGPPVW